MYILFLEGYCDMLPNLLVIDSNNVDLASIISLLFSFWTKKSCEILSLVTYKYLRIVPHIIIKIEAHQIQYRMGTTSNMEFSIGSDFKILQYSRQYHLYIKYIICGEGDGALFQSSNFLISLTFSLRENASENT